LLSAEERLSKCAEGSVAAPANELANVGGEKQLTIIKPANRTVDPACLA